MVYSVVDAAGEHLLKEKWRLIWRPFETGHQSNYSPILQNVLSMQSKIQCHNFQIPGDYPIISEGMRRYLSCRNSGIIAKEEANGPNRKTQREERGEIGGERERGLFRVPTNEEYQTPFSFDALLYTLPTAAEGSEGGAGLKWGRKVILCIHGGPHRWEWWHFSRIHWHFVLFSAFLTSFSEEFSLLLMAGYSLLLVNYRGLFISFDHSIQHKNMCSLIFSSHAYTINCISFWILNSPPPHWQVRSERGKRVWTPFRGDVESKM